MVMGAKLAEQVDGWAALDPDGRSVPVASSIEEALVAAIERLETMFDVPAAPVPPKATILASALPASPVRRRRPRLVSVESRTGALVLTPAATTPPPLVAMTSTDVAHADATPPSSVITVGADDGVPIAINAPVTATKPPPPPGAVPARRPAVRAPSSVPPPLPAGAKRRPPAMPVVARAAMPIACARTAVDAAPSTSSVIGAGMVAVPIATPRADAAPSTSQLVRTDAVVVAGVEARLAAPAVANREPLIEPATAATSRRHGPIVLALSTLGAVAIGLSLLLFGDATESARAQSHDNLGSEAARVTMPVAPTLSSEPASTRAEVAKDPPPPAVPAVTPKVANVAPPAVPTLAPMPGVKRLGLRRPAKVKRSVPAAATKPVATNAESPKPAATAMPIPTTTSQPQPAAKSEDLDSPFPR